ncbi:DUF2278 family protein [Pseudoroseicyclus aestuarii]|uniref:Uncharacterized protein YukJ n=1 Tax=Pseudoroseicyclus aestuarii TaxID=1795041 RepID=A0A318TBL1_9RHOB|nr:DUF2278 family protein [Pseudoroseicyclus aestuarii]PYE85728.1 uncharacterized protein YukJ [Pseudoroseicyclus aestuarii]
MPLSDYGVWTASPLRVTAERAAQDPDSPHIHLFYDDGAGGTFDGAKRASINVKSQSAVSELVVWHIPDFVHPVSAALPGLAPGFSRLPRRPGGLALDYIRGNLLDVTRGRLLPHDRPGPRDDIIDLVLPELRAAIRRGATVHLFGDPYSDGQGIHNIHMNQGSEARFRGSDGVWQDGAVLIRYPGERRVAALFFAFASQAVHTDDRTGHALPGVPTFAALLARRPAAPPAPPEPAAPPAPAAPPEPAAPSAPGTPATPGAPPLVITAALVNPVGAENTPGFTGRPETVWLRNLSDRGVSLGGWRLLNARKAAHVLPPDLWLPPGGTVEIAIEVPLSNGGGLISLLDPRGLKVDGVAYTADDAAEEGGLVLFR